VSALNFLKWTDIIIKKISSRARSGMKVKSFLKYVEIQTKTASMIPFALGTAYAFYRFGTFSLKNFVLMLVSLLSFDMTTTAINNYFDYKKARKKTGYGFEKHNAIVRDNIKEAEAVAVIVVLGLIAVIAGFVLYLNSNAIVLILGMMSFAVGVLYTAGPVPISRMPLGEVFSGFFMGFIIPFLAVYIHVADERIAALSMQRGILELKANIPEIVRIFLISVPAVTGIANIMLANNICDIEDDLENRRYTLPVHIGREKALILFKILYYAAFAEILISAVAGLIPATSLLVFATFIPVRKNIHRFIELQTKKDTFSLSVKNFAVMNMVLILSTAVAIIIQCFR
jgi:1,4-dihydroxy-2-naphthoate octaprenyltransferase